MGWRRQDKEPEPHWEDLQTPLVSKDVTWALLVTLGQVGGFERQEEQT